MAVCGPVEQFAKRYNPIKLLPLIVHEWRKGIGAEGRREKGRRGKGKTEQMDERGLGFLVVIAEGGGAQPRRRRLNGMGVRSPSTNGAIGQ